MRIFFLAALLAVIPPIPSVQTGSVGKAIGFISFPGFKLENYASYTKANNITEGGIQAGLGSSSVTSSGIKSEMDHPGSDCEMPEAVRVALSLCRQEGRLEAVSVPPRRWLELPFLNPRLLRLHDRNSLVGP